MNAIAIQRAAEVVRRRDEELPQHVRFPWRQRLGIDGMNVGVSQQAQTLQTFLITNRSGKS